MNWDVFLTSLDKRDLYNLQEAIRVHVRSACIVLTAKEKELACTDRIACIRGVHKRTDVGLKEAKLAVDTFLAEIQE